MSKTHLQLKRALYAALLVLLLSVVGMTKANAQTGALNGLFSVNDSTQVRFSQGNLQYTQSTGTWSFMTNQYDMVETLNQNVGTNYANQDIVSLFGWGTGINPTNTSTDHSLYDPFNEWGVNAISNGGNTANSGWRTLATAEWQYVFNTRTTPSGIRYAMAKVAGVNGVILLPDDWDAGTYNLSSTNTTGADFSSNIIEANAWPTLEAAGAVFLPAAGYRYGTSVNYAGSNGYYWSASPNGSTYAYYVFFNDRYLYPGLSYYNRYLGSSVRLVCPAENYTFGITATANPAEGGTVSGSGAYAEGTGCTLTATPAEGYTFINWTENGEVVSTENPYTFTVTGDRSLVANFEESITYLTSLSDDFNDGVIDPELWTYTGNTVLEEEGLLKLQQNVTDQDVHLRSVDLGIPENRIVNMNRSFLIHRASNYYNGRNIILLNGDWESSLSLEYVYTYHYNDSYQGTPKTGVYLITRFDGVETEVRLCDFSFDTWHTEYVVVDFAAETVSYYLDSFEATVPVPGLAEQTVNYYNVQYAPWGWWTGHYHNMDYVNINTNMDDTFTVTATANPAEGGTVSGGGTYECLTTCTLTATANEGYTFINWTENGEVVSTENPYTFTVTGDRELVANFVESSTHWAPNNTDYEENMPVTAVVEIDGVEQQSTTLELGAFSGEECRGSQMALYFEPTQRYLYQMTVFGEEGDEIAFRLYDHATNEELELVAPEAITFTTEGFGYGTLPNPIVLNFRHSYDITATANLTEGGNVEGGGTFLHGETCTLTATPNDGYVFVRWTLDGEVVSTEAEYTFEVTGAGEYTAHFNLVQTTNFSQGWNWWSSYVELNGSYGLEALENGLDANGVMIKSQNDGYVSYSEELGWYGSLVELYNEQSYRVKANAACTVQLQGLPTNPANYPVSLNSGWTWMGFPWSQSVSVESALQDFEPEANDLIKGRNAYTMYYNENGYSLWFGPLNSLEPGQGYVYYSNSGEVKTLTFNTNGGRSAQPNVTADNNLFRPETGNYADNMTLTAVVDLNGAELRSEDYEVAAFCNGECRGSAKLAYFAPTDSYIAFLTLYGNAGDALEFALTDGTTTMASDDAVRFASDVCLGTLSEPYTLHFGILGVDDAQTSVKVYPNPTQGVFSIDGAGIRRIEVFNAFGQAVYSEETSNETFRIDLSDKAAGVYMLRVVTESGVTNQQLIKE